MLKRLPGICLVLLLVSACSSTSFVYKRLDWILPWYLSDYVKLDKMQAQQLDLRLQRFLSWHRQHELPHYVAFLQRVQEMLDQPLTVAAMDQRREELALAVNRLQARAMDDWLLPLGEELSEVQVEQFIAALEKQQKKQQKKYLKRDLQAYHQDSYKGIRRSIERYLGRLTREQRGILKETVARMSRADYLWLEERQVWIERLRSLLQREDNWQEELRLALAQRQTATSPAYQLVMAHNIALIQDSLIQLINQRSERQERRLRRRLDKLQRELAGFSQQV